MIATAAAERAEFLAGEQHDRPEDGAKNPPSDKAFEVFHLVEIVGLSTRQAAAEIGLSQTRVVQLRDAVEAWICALTPGSERRTSEQRLRIAEFKANARLDHLYSQALEGWRNSKGEEVLQRADASGNVRVTIRQSHGKAGYLDLASRIVRAQAKLAIAMARAWEKTACGSGPAEVAATPSEEDCSVVSGQPEGSDEAAREAAVANDSAPVVCDDPIASPVAVTAGFRAEKHPVQPAVSLSSEQVAAPLSRRARRKLRRLVERRTGQREGFLRQG